MSSPSIQEVAVVAGAVAIEESQVVEEDEIIETTTTTTVEVFYEDLPEDYAGPFETTVTVEEVVTVQSIEVVAIDEEQEEGERAIAVASKEIGTIDGTIAALTANSADLVELNLKDNNVLIHEQGLVLAECLATNTILKSLDLSNTNINEDATLAIAKALEVNVALESLNLDGNQLTSNAIKAFAQTISVNTTLSSLRFGSVSVGVEAEKAIADAISANNTLKTFTLAFEDVPSRIAVDKVLARNNTPVSADEVTTQKIKIDASISAIAANSSDLVHLNLKDNTELIQDQGLLLVDALTNNTVLKSLDLSGTSLNEETAVALANTLKSNSTLESLNLEGSFVTYNVVKAFAQAISVNTTLKELRFGDATSVGLEAEQAIADALANNNTLSIFTLGFEDVSSRIAVDKILARNNTVIVEEVVVSSDKEVVAPAVTSTTTVVEEEFVEDLPDDYEGPFDSETTIEEVLIVEKTEIISEADIPAEVLAAAANSVGVVEIIVEETVLVETIDVIGVVAFGETTETVVVETIEEIVEEEAKDVESVQRAVVVGAAEVIKTESEVIEKHAVNKDIVVSEGTSTETTALTETVTSITEVVTELPVEVAAVQAKEVVVEETVVVETVTDLPSQVPDQTADKVVIEETNTSEVVTEIPVPIDETTKEVVIEETTTVEIVSSGPAPTDIVEAEIVEVVTQKVVHELPVGVTVNKEIVVEEIVTVVEVTEVVDTLPADIIVAADVKEVVVEEVIVVETVDESEAPAAKEIEKKVEVAVIAKESVLASEGVVVEEITEIVSELPFEVEAGVREVVIEETTVVETDLVHDVAATSETVETIVEETIVETTQVVNETYTGDKVVVEETVTVETTEVVTELPAEAASENVKEVVIEEVVVVETVDAPGSECVVDETVVVVEEVVSAIPPAKDIVAEEEITPITTTQVVADAPVSRDAEITQVIVEEEVTVVEVVDGFNQGSVSEVVQTVVEEIVETTQYVGQVYTTSKEVIIEEISTTETREVSLNEVPVPVVDVTQVVVEESVVVETVDTHVTNAEVVEVEEVVTEVVETVVVDASELASANAVADEVTETAREGVVVEETVVLHSEDPSTVGTLNVAVVSSEEEQASDAAAIDTIVDEFIVVEERAASTGPVEPVIDEFIVVSAPKEAPVSSAPAIQITPTAKTVFIGNLSVAATESSLSEYFSECGEIASVRIITGPDGKPKGFGYVDFTSAESAQKAVGFSHSVLEGRDIYVALSPQHHARTTDKTVTIVTTTTTTTATSSAVVEVSRDVVVQQEVVEAFAPVADDLVDMYDTEEITTTQAIDAEVLEYQAEDEEEFNEDDFPAALDSQSIYRTKFNEFSSRWDQLFYGSDVVKDQLSSFVASCFFSSLSQNNRRSILLSSPSPHGGRSIEYVSNTPIQFSANGKVILLSGPQGSGRTTVIRILADALDLEPYRIDLSALSDPQEISGDKKRSSVFAKIAALGEERMGTMVLFDNFDKIDTEGPIAQTVLSILSSPSHNFHDPSLNINIDLFNTLFVLTVTPTTHLPQVFTSLTKIHLIKVPAPTLQEVVQVAWAVVLPKVLEDLNVVGRVLWTRGAIEKVCAHAGEVGYLEMEKGVVKVVEECCARLLVDGGVETLLVDSENVIGLLTGSNDLVSAESDVEDGVWEDGVVGGGWGSAVYAGEFGLESVDVLESEGALGVVVSNHPEAFEIEMGVGFAKNWMKQTRPDVLEVRGLGGKVLVEVSSGIVSRDGVLLAATAFAYVSDALGVRVPERTALLLSLKLTGRIVAVGKAQLVSRVLKAVEGGAKKIVLATGSKSVWETIPKGLVAGVVPIYVSSFDGLVALFSQE
ncbi:UNVERIFIED_CONTAM: hypothetical protein HDU68_005081 [Siphonaria sp. JEL0065]|nr:hypothetical protein HDU68_005081 [Siphonaria sp. JEL0065]